MKKVKNRLSRFDIHAGSFCQILNARFFNGCNGFKVGNKCSAPGGSDTFYVIQY